MRNAVYSWGWASSPCNDEKRAIGWNEILLKNLFLACFCSILPTKSFLETAQFTSFHVLHCAFFLNMLWIRGEANACTKCACGLRSDCCIGSRSCVSGKQCLRPLPLAPSLVWLLQCFPQPFFNHHYISCCFLCRCLFDLVAISFKMESLHINYDFEVSVRKYLRSVVWVKFMVTSELKTKIIGIILCSVCESWVVS